MDLDVSSHVRKLAAEIFDEIEWNEVQKIAKGCVLPGKEKRIAIFRLKQIVPTRPKRPLYYVQL